MSRYDGLDAAELESLTGAPLVVVESSIPSTQDHLHRLAADGAPSGALVLAEEQTAGRGRQGRVWHSPAGSGLWVSVLLRPRQRPEPGAVSVRAGLAALDALREAAPGVAARLRWPNDVVVDGKKVGGILCEARVSGADLAWVVVGVGVNVGGPVAAAVRDRAVALADVSPGVSRLAVLIALVPRLRAVEAAPRLLGPEERRAFLAAAWNDPGAPDVVGLEPDGALLVRTGDGKLDRKVTAP